MYGATLCALRQKQWTLRAEDSWKHVKTLKARSDVRFPVIAVPVCVVSPCLVSRQDSGDLKGDWFCSVNTSCLGIRWRTSLWLCLMRRTRTCTWLVCVAISKFVVCEAFLWNKRFDVSRGSSCRWLLRGNVHCCLWGWLGHDQYS